MCTPAAPVFMERFQATSMRSDRVQCVILLTSRCRYLQGPGQEGPKILALGLSSRKNLCIHPRVAGDHPATYSCDSQRLNSFLGL